MHLLYNLSIKTYGFIIRIAALFNGKAKSWIKGRKDFFKNLPTLPDKPICWVHCASLGEFDMVLPVLRKLKEKNPDYFLVVTFFSPSGMNHYHKRNHPVDLVLYLPLDSPNNAKKFMSYLKPELGFIVKYEFWHNHILEAKKNGTKLYSIGTLFRHNQHYFKFYGGFFRKTLRLFDYFFTQNQNTIDPLKSIEIEKSVICGDPRIDQVLQNKKHFIPNPRIETFLKGRKALIIGSSWEDDEKVIFPFILEKHNYPVIIAPHDIREENIRRIEKNLSGITQRFTEEQNKESQVLILDTIGHLNTVYHYGNFAYVGGGFSGKLHNILEPAVFGLPVVFGPKHKRFPEAQAFIELGIGFSVQTKEDFKEIEKKIVESIDLLNTKTASYIESQHGIDEKIITHLI